MKTAKLYIRGKTHQNEHDSYVNLFDGLPVLMTPGGVGNV